jgi:hypothetical protein
VNDIRGYNVYAASRKGEEFSLIAENVRDTFYIDANLLSSPSVTKWRPVDRSGNIGELSDELCIDNCPYYELPNVFTPNEDDKNDFFSAYSLRNFECEDCPTIPDYIRFKCARFVQSVTFTVYNRWGQEVFDYSGRIGDEDNTIYIDWNGKDENGADLATGVYYYVAKLPSIPSIQQTKLKRSKDGFT